MILQVSSVHQLRYYTIVLCEGRKAITSREGTHHSAVEISAVESVKHSLSR